MSEHGCSRCSRSWADRHPAAAVTAGLFSLTLMAMMLSVHPVAAIVMLGVIGVGVGAWLLDRERDRRAATAARADRANRELMRSLNAGPVIRNGFASWPAPPRARPAVAARHVMNRFPTTPLATQPIRERVYR